jgi:hypothetical protein
MSYNAATVILVDQENDGRLRVDIQYTGDAGEPTVVKQVYVLQSQPTPGYFIRGEAMEQIARLNNTRTIIGTVPPLPFVLDITTPLPTNTPTPAVTYMAASGPFTPGATPQDVFTLTGSATRNVTVIAAGIATQQTTAGVNYWSLGRRSTANAGGTSASVAAAPSGATAEVLQYTANPTAGTPIARIWSGRVSSPAPASTGVGNSNVTLELGRANIKLAGINDVLAFNFNGAALPAGLSVSAWFAWVEN